MDFNAAHIGFVEAAYGLTAVCLVGLCIYMVHRDRQLARLLLRQKDQFKP